MQATMSPRRPSWSTGDWRDDAACRDEPLELFFPAGFSPAVRSRSMQAKSICWACPSRSACLEFAVATFQDHGIWGGLDEEERRALRRRRRARQA